MRDISNLPQIEDMDNVRGPGVSDEEFRLAVDMNMNRMEEERFAEEHRRMEEEFGETKFHICISPEEWDDVVAVGKCAIRHDYSRGETRVHFYHVMDKETITVKDVIHCLVDNGFNLEGIDHCFLEEVILNDNNEIELGIGS